MESTSATRERTINPHAVMALILKYLAEAEVIEDSGAFLRQRGVPIGFKMLAEAVLFPLVKNRQIKTENLHANRYTLAGVSASEASMAPSSDGHEGEAPKVSQGAKAKGKTKGKEESAVDDVAWRREIEQCIVLGSPEARIWRMVGGGSEQPTPLSVEELNNQIAAEPIFKGAMMEAKKNGWIEVTKDKATGQVIVRATAQHIDDRVQSILRFIAEGGPGSEDAIIKAFSKEEVASLKKRRFIQQTSFTYHRITRGDRFTPSWASLADSLTTEHLANGSWLDLQLKQYDFERLGRRVRAGGLHAMSRLQALARTSMLEMGFEELPRDTSSVETLDATLVGRDQFYSEEQRDSTFFVRSDADDVSALTMLVKDRHSALARVLAANASADTAKLFAVERSFTRYAKSKRKDRTARMGENGASSPHARQTQRRVLHKKMQHVEQLHLSGYVIDRQLSLAQLLGVLQLVCQKLGLSDAQCFARPFSFEGSACGINFYCKDRQRALHLGRGGLLHPIVARRLVRCAEGDEPPAVAWWELSLEAVGEALGYAHPTKGTALDPLIFLELKNF